MSEVRPGLTPLRQRLGDLLVEAGLVTETELLDALAEQQQTGERLGRVLVARGVITDDQLLGALARHFGLESVDLENRVPDFGAGRLVRESFARRHNVLPIGWEDDRLVVAMANPSDVFAVDDIRSMTGQKIKVVMGDHAQLERAIDLFWGSTAEEVMRLASDNAEVVDDELEKTAASPRDVEVDAPVVQFVNEVLAKAIADRASDLHLEPGDRELRIRFRVDGVLRDVMVVPHSIQAAVISRIKIMGDLDIAERRLPQDGRVTLPVAGRSVDLRLVTLPTTNGESLVIRILDRATGLLQLRELGLLPDTLARYRSCYQRPWGAVLVTGPTGSGKSTSLYAALNELHSPERNIVTVEDPVEYNLPGIKQVQVNRKAGLTFASALRSIVRADPDIVMVGEIRDAETASIGIEAALTGHLVLSTLHANDAASTPARLVDMGVEPFLVTSALTGVLAQRLVRRLCQCKAPYSPTPEELAAAGWDDSIGDQVTDVQFHRAVGCPRCARSGYHGRFAIHEVMPLTEELAHLVLQRASSDAVHQLAVEQGMTTLRRDGLTKAARGQTTFDELLRVVT